MQNFLKMVQGLDPLESQKEREIDYYIRNKKTLRRQINTNLELYVISKQWLREWKYYVDFLQGVAQTHQRAKVILYETQPGRINADLVSSETFLLTYPRDHIYNQKIIPLEPEDYVLVRIDMLNIWKQEYGIDLEIRRNVKFNQDGEVASNINLRRQKIYFVMDKIYQGVVQVDEGCKIKMWIQLLIESLKQQFKQNIQGVRLWRHKTFPAELAIKQLQTFNGQFNGELLDENQCVGNYNSDLIIVDIQKDNWQYTYLDQKIIYKEEFRHVFEKASKGCGKYHCTKNYCASNPVFSQIGFTRQDLITFLLELFKEENVDWNNVCWNQTPEPLPLQNFESNIDVITQFPDIFGASFVQNPRPNYEINPLDPELNDTLIKKINNLITIQQLQQWIGNLFQNAQQSPFLVRAMFIILNFQKFIQLFGYENSMLQQIMNLKDDYKNILTRYIGYLSDQMFATYIEAVIKNIADFVKLQSTLPVQLPKKKDINYLKQQLEFLKLFFNSNREHKRIQNSKFIIPEIAKMYPRYGDQLEFHQFDAFIQKDTEKYYFTFCNYPWFMPLDLKNEVLAQESRYSQRSHLGMEALLMGQIPIIQLHINRNDVIHSALEGLSKYGNNSLKAPLKVSFIGEQGVDQGGLTREFFSLLMQQLFDLSFGMFVAKNNDSVLWFNMHSVEMPICFELIGKILGLALYNQVLLDLKFPPLIFKKLMNEPTTFEDLKELDLDTYKGLNNLAEYTKDDLEETFCLNFVVNENCWGELVSYDLIPNGSKIPVTQQNKHEYIKLCAKFYLEDSIKKQFDLFKQGFWKVVNGNGIKLFTGEELQTLIVGKPTIDMYELQSSTNYDGYEAESDYIKTFWAFIHSLNVEQQKQFLFFCTGSDRVPVGGLKSLKFVIQKQGEDTEQLPSSHTCFNVFLLPKYDSTEKMIMKLQIALQNCEGFGLI